MISLVWTVCCTVHSVYLVAPFWEEAGIAHCYNSEYSGFDFEMMVVETAAVGELAEAVADVVVGGIVVVVAVVLPEEEVDRSAAVV